MNKHTITDLYQINVLAESTDMPISLSFGMNPRRSKTMNAIPLELKEANAFVEKLHRHHIYLRSTRQEGNKNGKKIQ